MKYNDILVGCTGFVGSNIKLSHQFDMLCNSKNVDSAFGAKPNLLVYSGVPAEMFLANKNPAADLAIIENAAENIRRIAPKRLVLISTIAVIDNPIGAGEQSVIHVENLTAYGRHRYMLEAMVTEIVPDFHILRLPALFGENMKKNFIYDLIHFFPAMLCNEKYERFSIDEPIITECYALQDNGFYKLAFSEDNKGELRKAFDRLGFSALNFTDSRCVYQFYNLSYLWEHIQFVVKNDIPLLHLAVQPLSAAEICKEICGTEFRNEIMEKPFCYDFRTQYAEQLGGNDGYIYCRDQVLSDLRAFIGEAE